MDCWLPTNYKLPSSSLLRRLIAAGDAWQLYNCGKNSRVLIANHKIGQRWVAAKLLDKETLSEFVFGENSYFALDSGQDHLLAPVTNCISVKSKTDAIAFAVSIHQTRKIVKDVSLHDAIYVERLSRLLPTWSVTEKVSDEHILGRWLTGGVDVSALSCRRMASLIGWMNEKEIMDITQYARLHNAGDAGSASMKSKSRQRHYPASKKSKGKQASAKKGDNEQAAGKMRSEKFRLIGRSSLEAFFNEHVIDIIIDEEKYKALGVDFPSAIILHGPPGCGKTFAVGQLGEFLDWPMFHIDSGSIGSPYIHETSRKVSKVFEKAMDNAPSIIVIDEMESYLSDRQINQSTGLHHVEEVAEFLRRIPEATSRKVLVVGMTNRLEMIDSAILRRGRFDHVIEVSMPSKEEVTNLVESLLEKMPVDNKLSLDKAIFELTECPLSDVAFVIREAGRLAARSGKIKIDQKSLDSAMAQLSKNSKNKKKRIIGFT